MNWVWDYWQHYHRLHTIPYSVLSSSPVHVGRIFLHHTSFHFCSSILPSFSLLSLLFRYFYIFIHVNFIFYIIFIFLLHLLCLYFTVCVNESHPSTSSLSIIRQTPLITPHLKAFITTTTTSRFIHHDIRINPVLLQTRLAPTLSTTSYLPLRLPTHIQPRTTRFTSFNMCRWEYRFQISTIPKKPSPFRYQYISCTKKK